MIGVLQLLLIFTGALGAALGLVVAEAIAGRSSPVIRRCYLVALPLAVVVFVFADAFGAAGAFVASALGLGAIAGIFAGWFALCLAGALCVGLGISPLRPNTTEKVRG